MMMAAAAALRVSTPTMAVVAVVGRRVKETGAESQEWRVQMRYSACAVEI